MKNTILFSLLILTASFTKAQNGEISGKVIDQNSDGIYPTNVTCTRNDSTVVMSVKGDKDGNYSIKPLSPGKYNIIVSAAGYFSQAQQGVIVSADRVTMIDVKLKSDPAYVSEKNKKRKRSKN